MIKRDLADFLKCSTAIAEAVGGRIYPNRVTQGVVRPYVVITINGGQSYNDLPGEADCVTTSFEITTYAQSDGKASGISELIRNRLSGYRGKMGDSVCISCAVDSPASDYQVRPTDGSDNWIFASRIGFSVFHNQAFANNK